MIQLIVFPFIAFLISFLIFPVIIKIFKKLNWFDTSGTHKIHSAFVPSMGGIPILIGAVLALLMALPLQQWIVMKYFFISVALMFLIGLRDDVLALSPRQKLFSQFLPVFVLIFLDQVILNSFYDLSKESVFPMPVSYLVTFLTVIIIANGYNLIDGIDGLAGSIGFLVLFFFGVWNYMAEQPFLSLIALCFAGTLFAFLLFNWQPSSIFMGDTGALTMGLILSFFAIRFINHNFQLPQGHVAKFNGSISTAVCVLIIPLFDTLRVIILRLRHGQSPFHADRNHIHHRFLSLGLSHAEAVKWIFAINVFMIGLCLLLKSQSDTIILPLVIISCLIINFVLKWVASQKSFTGDNSQNLD
jgi:UDP-GlcNAc:undecaprenyl-phosphate/decaprenyl-phosphate GlcNAc-1-phosphate transferase